MSVQPWAQLFRDFSWIQNTTIRLPIGTSDVVCHDVKACGFFKLTKLYGYVD